MKKLLFYALLLGFATTYAQQEAANWYFGQNAGIQFANDGSVTALNDGQLNTREGCSSISDADGNLLFYTDGSAVFNNQHNVMTNGFGLLGDSSSTQSAIVVPKPNTPNIYYIFTVGSSATQTGLKYSEVDMTLDGGLGAVTATKNINLLDKCSEKVTAVLKDCASQSIWVISLSNATGTSTFSLDSFHAFEVTTAGINTSAVVSTFNGLGISDLRGYLKLSPNGEKLACANIQYNGLFLFDFDTATGIVSNNLNLPINNQYNEPYGLEFSPNSELLYVSSSNDLFGAGDDLPSNHFSALTQFNLTDPDIVGSQQLIDQQNLFRSALQLGPNGKIYRSMAGTYERGLPFLSTINNPNEVGAACNYQNNAIDLGTRRSTQGLPPFISSFFVEKIDIINNTSSTNPISNNYLALCNGETYRLEAENITGATYAWSSNGIPLLGTDHFLDISTNGLYEVVIDLNNGGCDFLEGEALVEYFIPPVANPVSKIDACDDNNDGIWDFDLTIQDTDILNTQSVANYSVHYFESQNDADLFQNEITGLYTNQENPKEIFARVDLTGSPSCYDTSSFFIEVFNTPTANTPSTQEVCDNLDDGDSLNGQVDMYLHDYDALILDTQNPADYTITYHPTLNDAENNSSPLNEPHYNNINTFTETVFVRIENNLNTDCYDTTMFDIIVNTTPTAQDATLIQCDEDTINDGFTSFNLNEANTDLTAGATGVSVSFYFDLNDAQNSTDPLDAANYSNQSNPQTVFAQVIDDTAARKDWGWEHEFDLESMTKDIITNLQAKTTTLEEV